MMLPVLEINWIPRLLDLSHPAKLLMIRNLPELMTYIFKQHLANVAPKHATKIEDY